VRQCDPCRKEIAEQPPKVLWISISHGAVKLIAIRNRIVNNHLIVSRLEHETKTILGNKS